MASKREMKNEDRRAITSWEERLVNSVIDNEDDALAYCYGAGITAKNDAIRIQEEDASRYDLIVKDIIDSIKENTKDDWKSISVSSLVKDLGDGEDLRRRIVRSARYFIQNDPEIIARVPLTVKNKDKIKSKGIRMDFKTVPREEKEKLGLDALYYRNLQGEYLDRLKECLRGFDGNLNDIAYTADYLIMCGAGEKWVQLNPFPITRNGPRLADSLNALRFLEDNHYIVIIRDRNILEPTECIPLVHMATRPTKPYVRIAFSEEERNKFLSESMEGSIHNDIKEPLVTETTREAMDMVMQEFAEKYQTYKEYCENVEQIRNAKKAISETTSLGNIHHRSIFSSSVTTQGLSIDDETENMIKALLAGYRTKVETEIRNEYKPKLEESETKARKFMEAAAEVTAKETEIRQLKDTLEKEKRKIKAYKKHTEKIQAHIQDCIQEMQGEIMEICVRLTNLNPYEMSDKKIMTKIRMELFGKLNDIAGNLVAVEDDSVPNELVTNKERSGMHGASTG